MLPSPLLASTAKSFFTLHVSQYNVLAADLANNLKVIWSRGSGACGKKEGKNAATLPGCVSWHHDLRKTCLHGALHDSWEGAERLVSF